MAALQPDIQYVQFYTAGSAAYQIERKPAPRKTVPAVKTRKAKRIVIAVDPVAVCGLILAVFMLFAMGSGVKEYRQSLQQAQQMSQYVAQLQSENVTLQQAYHDSYDPDAVYDMAVAIGMVPRDQAQCITIQVEQPAAVEEEIQVGFWEELSTFLLSLFA